MLRKINIRLVFRRWQFPDLIDNIGDQTDSGPGMRRWFLSYHSPEQTFAERLKAAMERKDDSAIVFFAPANLRAGARWAPPLEAIAGGLGLRAACGEGHWTLAGDRVRRGVRQARQFDGFPDSCCWMGRRSRAWLS
jgi:hypothetical protein